MAEILSGQQEYFQCDSPVGTHDEGYTQGAATCEAKPSVAETDWLDSEPKDTPPLQAETLLDYSDEEIRGNGESEVGDSSDTLQVESVLTLQEIVDLQKEFAEEMNLITNEAAGSMQDIFHGNCVDAAEFFISRLREKSEQIEAETFSITTAEIVDTTLPDKPRTGFQDHTVVLYADESASVWKAIDISAPQYIKYHENDTDNLIENGVLTITADSKVRLQQKVMEAYGKLFNTSVYDGKLYDENVSVFQDFVYNGELPQQFECMIPNEFAAYSSSDLEFFTGKQLQQVVELAQELQLNNLVFPEDQYNSYLASLSNNPSREDMVEAYIKIASIMIE